MEGANPILGPNMHTMPTFGKLKTVFLLVEDKSELWNMKQLRWFMHYENQMKIMESGISVFGLKFHEMPIHLRWAPLLNRIHNSIPTTSTVGLQHIPQHSIPNLFCGCLL